MAAQTPVRVYNDGIAMKTALYRVPNVTSGDTIALSTDFYRIVVAAAFDVTRSLAYFAPSISVTTLTLTETNMANDEVWVLVMGAGA